MQNVFAPIANLYQTQLEASRQFADAIFSGTEKLDHVVLDATHRAFNEQLRFAQSLASVRDPQGVASAQSSFLSQRPDRAMDYQRELFRVFVETQNELGKSMRQYVEQVTNNTGNAASAAVDNIQEDGEDTAYNPVTGMFSVWESAFREVASLANRNMAAARSTFENAANSAYSTVNEAAEDISEAASEGTRERKSGSSRRSSKS